MPPFTYTYTQSIYFTCLISHLQVCGYVMPSHTHSITYTLQNGYPFIKGQRYTRSKLLEGSGLLTDNAISVYSLPIKILEKRVGPEVTDPITVGIAITLVCVHASAAALPLGVGGAVIAGADAGTGTFGFAFTFAFVFAILTARMAVRT